MSSSRPLCRDNLTMQQNDKAVATLVNLRPELVYHACPNILGDLDGDGSVSTNDLLILFANWGPCGDCNDCSADLDGDCNVGTSDLLVLFANWG